MTNYKVTLTSDTGKFTVKTSARDEQTLRKIICDSYGCPESAILKVAEYPVFYKVVKIGRISRRKQILGRGYDEQTAQRIVQSYPDSSRSMIFYINQNKW